MARAGMSDLISAVRRYSNAGTADYSVAGVTYWTDDQVQAYLDRYRRRHRVVRLAYEYTFESGEYIYKTYHIPEEAGDWFEQDGVGSNWRVYDTDGTVAPSHTVDYNDGTLTFDADTNGRTYYIDFDTFDVYGAAADVWKEKAGFLSDAVNYKIDNHDVEAEQKYQHALAMEKKYRAMAGAGGGGGVRYTRMVRADENP